MTITTTLPFTVFYPSSEPSQLKQIQHPFCDIVTTVSWCVNTTHANKNTVRRDETSVGANLKPGNWGNRSAQNLIRAEGVRLRHDSILKSDTNIASWIHSDSVRPMPVPVPPRPASSLG